MRIEKLSTFVLIFQKVASADILSLQILGNIETEYSRWNEAKEEISAGVYTFKRYSNFVIRKVITAL